MLLPPGLHFLLVVVVVVVVGGRDAIFHSIGIGPTEKNAPPPDSRALAELGIVKARLWVLLRLAEAQLGGARKLASELGRVRRTHRRHLKRVARDLRSVGSCACRGGDALWRKQPSAADDGDEQELEEGERRPTGKDFAKTCKSDGVVAQPKKNGSSQPVGADDHPPAGVQPRREPGTRNHPSPLPAVKRKDFNGNVSKPMEVSGTDAEYNIDVNLTSGKVTTRGNGSFWVLHPWPSNSGESCGLQAVLMLSFSKFSDGTRRKALIDLWFDQPTNWVFNIGDSKSNDGRSGDGSTQENDCEAEGFGRMFTVYRSDKAPDPFRKIIYRKENFLRQKVTFIVADQHLMWNNYGGNFDFIHDATLFALKGQSDKQGPVNYDIYLSMNRVIAGSYRSGHGLCRAAVKWLY